MGTSSSSGGPGPNVPLVPPWVPPLGDTPVIDVNVHDESGVAPSVPLAPPSRFQSSRLNLGSFARNGDSDALGRGVGSYFKTGYGGGRIATARFGGTAKSAGTLFGALTTGTSGEPRSSERDALEAAIATGGGTADVFRSLVDIARPIDGTQDAEASRRAIADTLAELMKRFPDVNILGLTPAQLSFTIATFIANDVFARFALDVGQAIIENAPSVSTGLARLKEAKEYIRETIMAQFRRLSTRGLPTTRSGLSTMVAKTLRDAIDVFEEYAP